MQHAGLGAKGGQQKERLLQLKAAGETWQAQGLDTAPHFMDRTGGVAIPRTWGQMMREEANNGVLKSASGATAGQ
jgi:hypothetical protein